MPQDQTRPTIDGLPFSYQSLQQGRTHALPIMFSLHLGCYDHIVMRGNGLERYLFGAKFRTYISRGLLA